MPDHVPCRRCGASLEIGHRACFVTCSRCGAELVVQRTRNAVHTIAMGESDAEPGDDAPPAPTLHRELAQLDRDWRTERQQYMVMNRHGRRFVPTPAGSLMLAAAVVGFGAVWTATAFPMGDRVPGRFDPFPFVGLILIVVGIVVGTASYLKARRYQKAFDEYRRRRQELLAGDEGE